MGWMLFHNELRRGRMKATRNSSMGVPFVLKCQRSEMNSGTRSSGNGVEGTPLSLRRIQSRTAGFKLGHSMFSLFPNFPDRATKTLWGQWPAWGHQPASWEQWSRRSRAAGSKTSGLWPKVGSYLHLLLVLGNSDHLRWEAVAWVKGEMKAEVVLIKEEGPQRKRYFYLELFLLDVTTASQHLGSR